MKTVRLHLYLWACFAAIAAASFLVVYLALVPHSLALSWAILPIFVAPLVLRRLIQNSRDHDRFLRIICFYESGIARLRDGWRGRGIHGEEFKKQQANHLYAADLDLFGRGSLFELLCTARTGIGRGTLASWLLEPVDSAEIRSRHEAVSELHGQLDVQEKWASVGAGFLDDVDSVSLQEWARTEPTEFRILSRVASGVLPFCLAVLLVLLMLGVLPVNWPLVVVFVLEGILALSYRNETRKIAATIARPSFELSLLGPFLEYIELGNFQSPLLTTLQSRLTYLSTPPSRKIRSLSRLAWLMDLRRTDLAIFLAPFLAGTNLAMRIELWHQRNQTELPSRLHALGQFEALLCLARHYHENPDWVFPVLRPEVPAFFRAQGLGHPLLHSKTRVDFDLDIGGQMEQLVIVSGSNMSGKSTLLRSVGTNMVLALAGSLVCATRLEVSCMCVACSISVQDSLQDDRSRFQAEVERLKKVLDVAREKSTLFLLDELLGGTNSNDRLYGAQAVIKQLMDAGALGIVTTHDLALIEIADRFRGRVSNVHFEERYVDGQMRFDYKMLPGVLTRTNGVNVMAALGLLPTSENPGAVDGERSSPD